MKKRTDPRHIKRVKLMQQLFAWDFNHKEKADEILEIIKKLRLIDKLIQKAAPQRPLADINKIDLAILRLSIFELIMVKGTPFKVVVDEAVELGKEYGGESSAGFINGVLGKVIENKGLAV